MKLTLMPKDHGVDVEVNSVKCNDVSYEGYVYVKEADPINLNMTPVKAYNGQNNFVRNLSYWRIYTFNLLMWCKDQPRLHAIEDVYTGGLSKKQQTNMHPQYNSDDVQHNLMPNPHD